ncbi:N,N-dimethylformamidase beta subunit family domain-containing protein [Allostreptomyces psammosilenae]|uniref:N,N-dimethylformamidase beta subunit-like C-terminal domain-containing protein n=1 Tax=Allostreptomyces psammosilenae TaxID=1892865 RepID=A0A853A3Z7_9ACTN|nr:N,N-dimethylformamidase beta subunit family domain-containing protein [Allostreptomyces psammosilenae]NYI05222.1 hypothetical protein [Allostreptomyces psammosilenae]
MSQDGGAGEGRVAQVGARGGDRREPWHETGPCAGRASEEAAGWPQARTREGTTAGQRPEPSQRPDHTEHHDRTQQHDHTQQHDQPRHQDPDEPPTRWVPAEHHEPPTEHQQPGRDCAGSPPQRWESGALAHGVADPFGQGPLPWLRGRDSYVDGSGSMVPWYVDLDSAGAPGTVRPRPGELRNADDVHQQIKGFATAVSVRPGERLDFKITANPPQNLTMDWYRIGHYGGNGAHRVGGSPRLSGIVQPEPLVAGRTVSCHHWWRSWRLSVPRDWRPGAYVAVLTSEDGHRSHIPFTVRDDEPADFLVVIPDITWQAYNLFPENGRTGASLYHSWDERGRLLGERDAATTVSFDRPYAGSGLPLHVGHAYDFIRWAERQGLDLAYASALDLHAGRVDPTRYRGLVFTGHDEYWSAPMRQAVEAARDAGTSLVFLSANTMYWQVQVSASPSGEPDRLVSCRKNHPDRSGRTAHWRVCGEPEQLVLGVQYERRVAEPVPLVVRNAGHWLWEGTGLAEEDTLPGLVAAEADRYMPRVPLPECSGRVLLSHSPYRDEEGRPRHQQTSLYRAPSGAWVFASGTFAWTPALDRPGCVDERVQRATANLLDRIRKSE